MVVDFDDMGCNHIISDQTQSKDCRDALDKLHYANPSFKAVLFAIPGEMTAELCDWCEHNASWIELAVHGFFHKTNTECLEMSYEEFDDNIKFFQPMLERYFTKGFKAPGWQISDDIFKWLVDNGWWVSDQNYNNDRRPKELRAYVNHNGVFKTCYNGIESDPIPAYHGHCWDTVGNGIYEQYELIESLTKSATEFKFVSEVLNEINNSVSGESN